MQLPNDFNCEMYRKHYSDLKHLTDDQVKEHYINHGIYEGRRYSDELPECINKVIVNTDLIKSAIWKNTIKDNRFKQQQLKLEPLQKRLQCSYEEEQHFIFKNFLIFKNTNNNIVLFSVSNKYVFISDVTHYDSVDAIYNFENKQLTISNIKKTNYFIELVTIFTDLVKKHNKAYTKHLTNIKNIHLSSFLGVKQIMHHYVNEMSGLYNLLANTPLHTIYSQFEYYGKHEILLESKLNKTEIKRNISVEDVFLQTCTDNLFFIKQCDSFVPTSLNKRVIDTSVDQNTPDIFKNYNKCFLFTVRNSYRKLTNQVGFIVTCIREFNSRFPNSVFLIDGISKLYNTELTENSKCIQQEKNTYLQICERLKQVGLGNIKIYSLIFEPIDIFITYAQYVNYYISHVGTCQHKSGYFSNAIGVVHGGGESKFVQKDKDGWYWGAHFGKKCTCLDNNMFTYDDINSYTSNYIADLSKCRDWAKSVPL